MQLKIITHERIVFDGEVDELVIQTPTGQMGILKDHIPVTTVLDVGVTKAKVGDKEKFKDSCLNHSSLLNNFQVFLVNMLS